MKPVAPWILMFLFGLISGAFGAAQIPTNADTHFQFRTPRAERFQIDPGEQFRRSNATRPEWVLARRENATNAVELGSRVVVQLKSPGELNQLIRGRGLELARRVGPDVFILQAPDAWTAAREAQRLSALPNVSASYPVIRRYGNLHSPYAPRSQDEFFLPYFNNPAIDAAWFLENRNYDSTRLGIDLNVLAAWPLGMGQGVTVAVADTGMELHHPELAARVNGMPHYNFAALNTNATPRGGDNPQVDPQTWTHGTSVAGLIAAEANNNLGAVGVAPQAGLASWLIFASNGALAADDQLMDMYQFAPETVSVQNHSWGAGNGHPGQDGATLLEQIGISNAVTLSRGGLGTVLVRAAGNDRGIQARADDDSYVANPHQIAVGAISKNGRVTAFSEPGACLLVAAPGGDTDGQGLFTIDLVGLGRGVSPYFFYSDYRFGAYPFGFVGTSGSAPLVSGVVALILSVNTNLGYRDVQQILALSSRHADLADPDLKVNGAGFWVSHNAGFGVPDSGHAVWLATFWSNRPPVEIISTSNDTPLAIPDEGLRVQVTGDDIPSELISIPSRPSLGLHADDPTPELILVEVGQATNVPPVNLTNKGALILRGENTFAQKISNVAQAGAAFAVIYNYSTNVDAVQGGENLVVMAGTEFVPIPAVFIGHSRGELMKEVFQTNSSARARIHLQSVEKVFSITNTLLCEHVGVRVQTDHSRRGDGRITLVSPQGTRSILQQYNNDNSPGPTDWTYWSTHHFFESSAGDWKVYIADEFAGETGSVQNVTLILRGTSITDTDHDGLDDVWETTHLGSLSHGPKDDPDGDGFSNVREQLMGTQPAAIDFPFAATLSWWELAGYKRSRLTWPSGPQYHYSVYGGPNLNSFNFITNTPGAVWETEWVGHFDGSPGAQFFRVYSAPAP